MFSPPIFIINSFFGYFLFNKSFHFLDKYYKDVEKTQCVINIGHAFLTSYLSISYLMNYINQYTWYYASGLSCGYAIHDLILTYKIGKYKDMLVHHSLMIIVYLYPIVNSSFIKYVDYYPNFISSVYLCEISTIFFTSSYFLYHTKQTENTLFKISSIMTLLTYFPLRVCNFTYLCYYLFRQNNMFAFYCMIPFTGLNYYWFYKILCKAKKSLKKD